MDGKICRPSTSCDNFPNLMLILKSSPGSSQCYGANIHAATHSTTVRLSWSQRRNSTCRFPEIVFHNLANTLMGLLQNMNTYSNPSDDPNMPKLDPHHADDCLLNILMLKKNFFNLNLFILIRG